MNKNLKNWANSYSGCDGGTLNSQTWLCGIEWAYAAKSDTERQHYYKNILPKEISNGYVDLITTYNFFTDESLAFPFNLSFVKMYSAIYQKKKSNYTEIKDEILKLNLSPIAFSKDDQTLWSQHIVNATGFNNKASFIKYIAELTRFCSIRNQYKPKLIICIGNSHKHNFSKGFFGDIEVQFKNVAIKPEETNKNQNNRYIHFVKHDGTLLVVTPFSTSSNGLNSDYLLQITGEKIRDLLNE